MESWEVLSLLLFLFDLLYDPFCYLLLLLLLLLLESMLECDAAAEWECVTGWW